LKRSSRPGLQAAHLNRAVGGQEGRDRPVTEVDLAVERAFRADRGSVPHYQVLGESSA
jgi:fructose-1,6-bisphosphatase/inositol monophosphatase family enzyme